MRHDARMAASRARRCPALAMALLVVIASTACSSHGREASGYVRDDRWVRSAELDGGNFRVEHAPSRSVSSRSKEEALADLRSTGLHHTPVISVTAVGWGDVTIAHDTGQSLPGFNRRPAWTIVFRTQARFASCPQGTGHPNANVPASGAFSDVQVFVIADDGTAVQYSQPGSWFCGLPRHSDIAHASQLFAAPWTPITGPSSSNTVMATVPDCVPQLDSPLAVPLNNTKTVAIRAYRPYPPATCPTSRTVLVNVTPNTPDEVTTVPRPIECLTISDTPLASPSINCNAG